MKIPLYKKPVRIKGILVALLLAGSVKIYGASFWSDKGAVVDETIADSPPPASSLAPAANQIPSAKFRYPAVDSLENVTFIVDPPNSHGIYRSDAVTRQLSELVTSKITSLPGSGSVADYIRGLETDGHDFVFNATDLQGGRGLYFWRGGKLQMIARTGTPLLPGDSVPLTDVSYGSLSGGNILFTAEAAGNFSMVLHDVDTGASRVVLQSGAPIPGQPGATFEYISPVDWIEGQDVAFRAARARSPRAQDVEGVEVGVQGVYGWFDIMPANPADFSSKNLRTIADWTTPIPGMEGRRFTSFHSTPVTKGLVAFVGGAKGCEGIYFYDAHAKDPKPRVIVDTETRLPSLFEGTFQGFANYPSVIDGCIIFTAHAAGGYAGVFLYNAGTDTLFRLADTHQPIESKTVSGFQIAGRVLVRNRFAISASFADGSSGVYLATIPVEGFTRMGAPGL